MTLKQWLTKFLCIVVALQSMSAVADMHRYHQSGVKHLTFDHDHDAEAVDQSPIQKKADAVSPADKTKNAFDCHHCCHCHHTLNPFVSGAVPMPAPPALGRKLLDYYLNIPSPFLPPDSRPPIV